LQSAAPERLGPVDLDSIAEKTQGLSRIKDKEMHTWKPLHQLNLYRVILSAGFILAFFDDKWTRFPGDQNPQAYLATAFILLFSSLIFIYMKARRKPSFEIQVILSNASDILLITLLSHYSGGLSSSLSILLIINITATGTFLRDRDSFLFAAMASLAVLSEQTYSMVQGLSTASEYSLAGLLGLMFFGITYLASVLAKRMRVSEKRVTEQEADIVNLQKLNDDIIQSMRTGIIVIDNNGQIRMANSSAETLLGHISLQNRPLLKNILPTLDSRLIEWQEQPNMHHKAIPQEHGLPDIQPGFRKLKHTEHSTDDTLIFLEDATQLNQRFQQIKLASLGRLTASIAHEIRNPLSAINHAAQLLQESELDKADKKLTGIITSQVKRLDKVVENVLQLSRQQKGDTDTIELNLWLDNFKQTFLQTSTLLEDQLNIKLTGNDIIVLFDASHLEQVMCNLCTNAIAHHHLSPEHIEITIQCGHDTQSDQPYIEITDNGPGIEKKIAEQIFDPFFTTNTTGTGLGLYISKEIIESNRGKISYTELKDGSCFKILFLAKKPPG